MENTKSAQQAIGEWLGNTLHQTRHKDYIDINLINIGSNLLKNEQITPEEQRLAGSVIIDVVQLLMILKANDSQTDNLINFLTD